MLTLIGFVVVGVAGLGAVDGSGFGVAVGVAFAVERRGSDASGACAARLPPPAPFTPWPAAVVSEPAPTEVTPPRASWKVGWRATVRPTPSARTRAAVVATVRPIRVGRSLGLRRPHSAQSRPIAPRRIGIST